MKNKGFFKTAAALLAAIVLLGGFSVTAYAGGGEDIPTNDSGVIVETEPQPLTPDGNLSLIDDIEGEAAEDKQFIIVQSKNGNYFYIIVDRAAEGENTVHFLNQVDEADLMALMEDGSGKAQIDAAEEAKLIPANIREGITVLGVLGTMSGSEGMKPQAKNVTPTFASQEVLPDEEYNCLSSVTVAAIPIAYTDNAQGGKTVTIG